MPDWSYHPLKKLLLSKMRPVNSREFIHQSMSQIASIPGGRHVIEFLGHMKPSSQSERKTNLVDARSPIGLSGIIDPNLTGLRAFQHLGFGFIEIGPVVLQDFMDAEPPITTDDRQEIQISRHAEKVTLQRAIRVLTNTDVQVPVLARLDQKLTLDEAIAIIDHLTPYVNALVVTEKQAESLSEHKIIRPLIMAYTANEAIKKNDFLRNNRVEGICLDAPMIENDGYLHESENANETLVQAVKKVKKSDPNFAIITSGGIEDPADARLLDEAGVDLMLLTTGYVKAGPGLPKRIHERLLYDQHDATTYQWHWSFLFGLAILIGGLIALYFSLTSIILPYDEAFLGITRSEILQVNPLILAFMSHDRMSLAGTMISGGIIYIQLARHGIRYGLHWAKVAFHTAAIVGFLGILLFIGYGYFDWLHGLFWLILLPIYFLSWKEGKQAKEAPTSKNEGNNQAWLQGLYGQLLFVVLGFAIVVGGIVISTIGVTDVFVSTDLSFLCMPAEMLNEMNDKLIPVIAHDRTGFGGALISVGLLVLMLSLWGFRQGERWIWNTIAIGAIPAFAAGIGTHLYIGYTTFIHLLPVYFLVILYVVGLILTYRFLKK
ncbi:dihydroorotate dehydrogenase [Salinibacillus xinjiangensis]|uniref:Dihydroorotate dehydrogenase n=1 Tax=Salinibacillus xinjiangensis TaxID=1229268 RepID=A0A6G1X5S9_9BACI|nr:dihydroorotate dehydrogenase [Salinibacillus xinjiangensis]MRG86324.1 dihydroorotate dehydrogenase [Salinibacillus xinjiangensis]